MRPLSEQTVVVAGATGNVGPFLVKALLERGASVVVSSRTAEKLDELREHLSERDGGIGLDRLHGFVGDLSDETEAGALGRRIADEAGPPDSVVASVGEFVTTPSVLGAGREDLQRALDGYLLSNLVIARTFLPAVRDSGGTYVLLQGPLAFAPRAGLGAALVSIATAGQHMLFRSLAQEIDDGSARVVELVSHAFVRDRQTQPGSALTGEDVAAFTAHLLSAAGDEIHGRSIDLRSPEDLGDVVAPVEGRA